MKFSHLYVKENDLLPRTRGSLISGFFIPDLHKWDGVWANLLQVEAN